MVHYSNKKVQHIKTAHSFEGYVLFLSIFYIFNIIKSDIIKPYKFISFLCILYTYNTKRRVKE